MDGPNINEPAWDREVRAPFANRQALIGRQAGAERLGATLYEIEPGGSVGYLHFHHANEELAIVVAGEPTLRLPGGAEQVLKPGDVKAFPAGPEGTHQLVNNGSEPARVLVCSTMDFPDIVEHVEYDKVMAIAGPTTITAWDKADAKKLFSNPPRAAD